MLADVVAVESNSRLVREIVDERAAAAHVREKSSLGGEVSLPYRKLSAVDFRPAGRATRVTMES